MGAIDSFRLDNKVAVLTGGTRGIGRSIAGAFASAGAEVVVCSRSEEACETTASELRNAHPGSHLGIACDVSDLDQIERVFDNVESKLGGVDVFVHCAGVSNVALAAKVSAEDMERMMRIHYVAGVTGAQHALASMRNRGGGSVIMVGSIWGLGGSTGSIAYGSAKAALIHSTRTMAIEWARYDVRVNALIPGFVETDMTKDVADDVRESFKNRIPMQRGAAPDEMAGPALFLASDASSYVTGQTLVVDGGERAR